MVFLKHLLGDKTTSLLLCLAVGTIIAEVESTKIAYTKPINGKPHSLKFKSLRPKVIESENPTTTTTQPLSSEMFLKAPSAEIMSIFENLEGAESAHAIKTFKNSEENQEIASKYGDEPNIREQLEPTLDVAATHIEGQSIIPDEAVESLIELPENDIEAEHVALEETSSERLPHQNAEYPNETQTNSSEHPTNTPTEGTDIETTTPNKGPTPCTCGIFMTSQIKKSKNPYEQPTGEPVIANELDRTFPCNAVGQKQCQTKCVEAIVQHLPNSANILCATLDRDIRKERAYLYIKNCRNQWFNTNLAAGREYCCKNNQPYQCPLV